MIWPSELLLDVVVQAYVVFKALISEKEVEKVFFSSNRNHKKALMNLIIQRLHGIGVLPGKCPECDVALEVNVVRALCPCCNILLNIYRKKFNDHKMAKNKRKSSERKIRTFTTR